MFYYPNSTLISIVYNLFTVDGKIIYLYASFCKTQIYSYENLKKLNSFLLAVSAFNGWATMNHNHNDQHSKL